MEDVHHSYGKIYRVIRETNASGYSVPSLRIKLHQAIDALKMIRAPENHITIAERISVTLHALDCALLRRDEARRGLIAQSLKALEEQWLCAPVPRTCEAGA